MTNSKYKNVTDEDSQETYFDILLFNSSSYMD